MPRSGVPTRPPTTREINFTDLVRRAWGDDWLKKDIAYEFSNKRRFEVSEPNGGPYTGTTAG